MSWHSYILKRILSRNAHDLRRAVALVRADVSRAARHQNLNAGDEGAGCAKLEHN